MVSSPADIKPKRNTREKRHDQFTMFSDQLHTGRDIPVQIMDRHVSQTNMHLVQKEDP